ncbi:MAG TPA: hypothetical protein VEZ41_10420 [Allosphingosinicella sp.]|nr:hypothetical protein [Allosphingosinicella sp.]
MLVFWRGDRDGWKGHVGFYVGEEPKQGNTTVYHVLGGNQSNKVCVARLAANRLLAARWPATAPMPTGARLRFAKESSILSDSDKEA